MQSWFEQFASWYPGALGLILRRQLYAPRLKSCGKGLLVGRFVKLYNPGRIELGDRVVLHDGVILDADGSGTSSASIRVGDDVFIGVATLVKVTGFGEIEIETGTSCGSFCKLITDIPLTIGRDCLIAAYCCIGKKPSMKGSLLDSSRAFIYSDKKTIIGPGCWLGVRTHLKPGVKIGEGVIVGAHAVVDTDIPDYTIAYGRPAQVRNNRATINTSGV